MITVKVSPADVHRFQTYLPNLSDPLPSGAIGLVADIDGLFAGTALVIAHPSSQIGSISVLHTPELFRNLGVGSRMLQEAERHLLELGCMLSRVTLTLRKDRSTPELDFFRKRGYDNEQLLYRSYMLRSGSVKKDELLQRLTLPKFFELKPLMSASVEERAKLEQMAASLEPDISPFQEERVLHAEFSMFLKVNGEIAGWIGIQQLASNLLMVRSMYVHPKFRLHTSGIAMFVEIHRKTGMLDRFAYQMLNVNGDNSNMLRLADRRLAPHAAHIKSVVRLEKRL
ncbi:GNAT family N-acetyltransferase [Saccharibacillus sp. JS10]|uniref:GNAT family N-acetyltransferase n=1 Tax=Saccharibacillus sp. JS10 TaxID=2950552 RepID=UPI00210885C2|nr:GNAT family N-acetyltransferase [Saccharibacillus sp. JS10]MCQ4085968.1 GNAT family N-acetyltransferase [Saccharibacillus sp. JS10]